MAIKNNKRTKITKLLLKNSLIELMHEKSIGQITITEICKTADLNRSTFYLHYTDQFDLLSEIENEITENTLTYLKGIRSDAGALSYIRAFLHYVKENTDIFHTLLCCQENITFQTLLTDKIMEHVKSNVSYTCSTEKEKYIYTFIMQGCVHILKEWIDSGFDLPDAEIAEIIFKLSDQSLKNN